MYSIFIIEDNPADITLIRTMLQIAGIPCAVVEVKNHEGSIRSRIIEASPLPDLLIVDGNLPGLSSYDVISLIRGAQSVNHVPIVVLTGLKDSTFEQSLCDLGVREYLVKPSELDGWLELGERLKTLLVAGNAPRHE